jgi:hypothetical protein
MEVGVCSSNLGASQGMGATPRRADSAHASSVVSGSVDGLDGRHSDARPRAPVHGPERGSVIGRPPRIGDVVWVGSDMRTAESRKGRVVLSITTPTGEVAYVVKLERPALNGARTVRAHATELAIFPDY